MILRKDLLLGHSIKNNTAPPINTEDFIRLQGTANGRSSSFGISECVIQKHLLLDIIPFLLFYDLVLFARLNVLK